MKTLINPRFKRAPFFKSLAFHFVLDASIFEDIFLKGEYQDTAIIYSRYISDSL